MSAVLAYCSSRSSIIDFQIAQNVSRLQLLPRLVNYYYNYHDDGLKRYVIKYNG